MQEEKITPQKFDEDYRYDSSINEAYANLANAIILSACKDYVGVIKDRKHRARVGKKQKPEDRYPVCRFFNSDWFDTLCRSTLNGKELMKQLEDNFRKYGKTIPTPADVDQYEFLKRKKEENKK